MKNLLLFGFLFINFLVVGQQLTSPMNLLVNSPAFIAGELNYGYPLDFGPVTMTTVTGDVAWGFTGTGDSLCCTPIVTPLTGKIALIRRGLCDFTTKIYEAQQAGAIGCLIINNNPSDVINMTGATNSGLITIPSALISSEELVHPYIDGGSTVNMSFSIRSTRSASVSYAGQTPLSQVTPLQQMGGIIHNNTNATLSNVESTLIITDPIGGVANFGNTISSLAPGTDDTVVFNGTYTPTMLGEYTWIFRSGINPIDSVIHTFRVTNNTFSLDNGSIDQTSGGFGLSMEKFQNEGYTANFASNFHAGPNGFIGDSIQVTFALENAGSYVGEEFELMLLTPLSGDVLGSQINYSQFEIVGNTSHTITSAEATIPNTLITNTLQLSGAYPNVLEPLKEYVLVLLHNGNGVTTAAPKVAISHNEDYLKIDQIVMYQNILNFEGWPSSPAYGLQLNLVDCAPAGSVDSVSLCQGDSLIWMDGNTYTMNNTTATHVLQRANGCDSIVTLNLAIQPINILITNNDPTLTADLFGATSYQWIDCNNGNQAINGATNQSFTPTSNGMYAVMILDSGCTATSACETIQSVGLAENKLSNIHVYPNPTNADLTIDLGAVVDRVTVTFLELNGKVLFQEEFKNMQMLHHSLKNYTSGMYYIRVSVGDAHEILKVIRK